jgi:pilus assembly protein CpaB
MAAKRYTVVFYAAIVVALIATFGVYRVLEATKASSRVATAPVVIAAKDVPEGKAFDRTSVVVAQWPVPTIPPGSFSAIDSVMGRVARIAVFKGEPIVPGRLAPEGTAPGLEVKITPGKRAFGLRINDVAGIAGMVQPNSRVDIMVIMDNDAQGKRVAKLFMSNMRVLAIGPVVQRADDGRPINSHVATIEVTPDEAERLAIAQSQGQIALVLRGYGDPDSIQTKGATSTDVLTQLHNAPEAKTVSRPRAESPRPKPPVVATAPAPAPIVQAPPKPKLDTAVVRIFRAGKQEDKKFQKDSAGRDTTATPR